MLKLLEIIFYGHAHRWDTYVQSGSRYVLVSGEMYPSGTYETRQCTVCHRLKTFESD